MSNNNFDFVFIDCDKILYPKILLELLKVNTKKVLVFDNILWHGRILTPSMDSESDQSIIKTWEIIKEQNLKYTLFPSGDGMLLVELI